MASVISILPVSERGIVTGKRTGMERKRIWGEEIGGGSERMAKVKIILSST